MVLRGQIVTMDGTRRVLRDGLLYIDKGSIVAVTEQRRSRSIGL